MHELVGWLAELVAWGWPATWRGFFIWVALLATLGAAFLWVWPR